MPNISTNSKQSNKKPMPGNISKKKFEPKKHHWIMIIFVILAISTLLIFFSPLNNIFFPPVKHQSLVTLEKLTNAKNIDISKLVKTSQVEEWLKLIQDMLGILGAIGGAILTWRKVLKDDKKSS